MKVTSLAYPSVYDLSDSNFAIVAIDTAPPSLIMDFNASDGEDGRSTLTWTDPSDPDVAEILVLRKEDGWPESHTDTDAVVVYQAPAKGPGEDEQYVDTGLENGKTYYYAVFSCDAAGNWNDTVEPGKNADTATPGVTRDISVISPNGGEEWPVGSTQEIRWESRNAGAYVKIEYSTDGGTTWKTIEDSTENDGSYSWTVPDDPSDHCRVRITSKVYTSVQDTSDADFSIVERPDLELLWVDLPETGGLLGDIIGAPYSGTCGYQQSITVYIKNRGGNIIGESIKLDLTVSLIDYKLGYEKAWNGWDTLQAIKEGKRILDEAYFQLELNHDEILDLNNGRIIGKTITYRVPDRLLNPSPIWTDVISFKIDFENDADPSNNVVEYRYYVEPGLMKPANVLVFTVTTYVGKSATASVRARVAAQGIDLAWTITEIAEALYREDRDSFAQNLIWLGFKLVELGAKEAKDRFFAAIITFPMSFLTAASDLAYCLAYDIAMVKTLIDRGYSWAQELWKAFGIDKLVFAFQERLFTNLDEAVKYGVITMQNVWDFVANGAITVGEALEKGLIGAFNIAEGISRGIVDATWAIAHGLGNALSAARETFFWWLGSPVDILLVNSGGQRTGYYHGSKIVEIPESRVVLIDNEILILIPAIQFENVTTMIFGQEEGYFVLKIYSVNACISYDPVETSSESRFLLEPLGDQPQALLKVDSDGDGQYEGSLTPRIWLLPKPKYPSEQDVIIHGPNPVPPGGCIFWLNLPDDAVEATLNIFDVDGALLVSIPLDPDTDRYPETGRWVPQDAQGRLLGTGLYLYLVEIVHADGTVTYSPVQKMVIQR